MAFRMNPEFEDRKPQVPQPPTHMTYEGGAIRSEEKLPFHLIPSEAQYLEAERFAFGSKKYGIGNWLKGDKQFFVDCWTHMYEHMLAFRDGTPDDNIPNVETHLGAIRWNAAVIAWGLKHGKVTIEDFTKGVTLGPA